MQQTLNHKDYLLKVKGLSHKFGREEVLCDINFTIYPGQAIALVGPSGCGKTTLLRLCSGLLDVEHGSVVQRNKRTGYMFQTPRLLPWENASKNIMLGLRARKLPIEQGHPKVNAIAASLGLTQEDLDKYPYQLSGGMQSRVAMCRALIIEPDFLFLDEPFTGLDIGLKRELMIALKKEIVKDSSALMITHDLAEAVELAHEILVMYGKPGRIALRYKIDTPIHERNTAFIHTELEKLLKKKEISQAYNLKPSQL